MNSRVAAFINNHEDEIDTDDFHSVFTAAYQELDNNDTRILYNDLCDTFGTEFITKQRETALYFIISMLVEDFDPKKRYSFGYIYEKLMHENILGLRTTEFGKYLRDNAVEFGLNSKVVNGVSVYTKKKV